MTKKTNSVVTLDAEELRQFIEGSCIRRIGQLGLKGKKMRDDECAFIAGAMTAIQAINPDRGSDAPSSSIPMQWQIAAMRGQSPFETTRGKK